jgi:phosphoglycerol transferase MdoB-like AlkP superfamily enzyme
LTGALERKRRSIAASTVCAVIAYVPALASGRIPLALGLVAFVAALTSFGHGGRMVFAVMTWLFIIAAVAVLALGWASPHSTRGSAPITGSASPALLAIVLAFPVAMALAMLDRQQLAAPRRGAFLNARSYGGGLLTPASRSH